MKEINIKIHDRYDHDMEKMFYIDRTTCPFSSSGADCGSWCPFFEYFPDENQVVLRCTGTEVPLRVRNEL